MPNTIAILPVLIATFLAAPNAVLWGEVPTDRRLDPLVDLNGYFPFHVPDSAEQWQQRASEVRRRILVSQGLWPMPGKTPLNAVVHGKTDQGDYTIEKVYFESAPGFYVTGSLFRPKGEADHHRAAVLCPHGHWSDGRFYDAGPEAIRELIVQGAERFEDSGRNPMQARCVQLARMGCVVFQYDMIGYADNLQLSFELAHRFAEQRADMTSPNGWGLFSPRAESHLQSIMGLQTWNSIRALDFVTALPDVDATRIAVTGASGGGTQTFIVSAIDPRVKVSVPAVMVSTAMQGGCTCENASLLRVGTGNVEFAALFAPKPLCLIAANDWTRELPTKGFPELNSLYAMLGAEDSAELNAFIHFPHNYNQVSRSAMYRWLNRHLQLAQPEPIVERDFSRLTAEELTVWSGDHPKPAGGAEFEKELLQWWTGDAQRQLSALIPSDPGSLRKYQQVVGAGIDAVIGRRLPLAGVLKFEQQSRTEHQALSLTTGRLRNSKRGEELPVVLLQPAKSNRRIAIWLSQSGKAGLFDPSQAIRPAVKQLLSEGVSVVGVDLFGQGDFVSHGGPATETRRVENPREAACYTFGYNHTLFAERVHDVLTVIAFVRDRNPMPDEVYLVGLDGSGHWAAAARAQAGGAVHRTAVDTGGFRFADVACIHSPDFLPGGAKYDDLPGMLAVAAPHPLWITGEPRLPPVVTAAYRASGGTLDHYDGPRAGRIDAAIRWLGMR